MTQVEAIKIPPQLGSYAWNGVYLILSLKALMCYWRGRVSFFVLNSLPCHVWFMPFVFSLNVSDDLFYCVSKCTCYTYFLANGISCLSGKYWSKLHVFNTSPNLNVMMYSCCCAEGPLEEFPHKIDCDH